LFHIIVMLKYTNIAETRPISFQKAGDDIEAVPADARRKNKEKDKTMKNKLFLIGLSVLLILPASLWAIDISGKWKAAAPGSQGNVELILTFEVEGTKLTGTLDNPEVGPADIKDGKIVGETVSFHLDRNINGMDMKIIWKGTVADENEIKFKRTWEMSGGLGGGNSGGGQGGGGPAANDIIAKRVK